MGLRPPRGPPREKGPSGPHFRTANSATRSTRAINGAAAAAAGRGPSPPDGEPPSPSPRLRLRAFCGSPRWAPPGPLLRSPRAALAPLRVAGPGGARSGRRRFAAPLRRLRPRFARRGRAALACPPLSRSASCAPLRGSAGARWPRLPSAPVSRRCGLPDRSPLLCSSLGLVQRVAPRGAAAGPLPASGLRPLGYASPGRLRARRLLRPPPGGLRPPVSPSGGGRLGCARLRRLLGASAAAAAQIVGFSPASPPPLRPPLGGCGVREARSEWLRPPLEWCGLLPPLSGGPPCPGSGPRCAVFGVVNSPEIVNRPLTVGCKRGILGL